MPGPSNSPFTNNPFPPGYTPPHTLDGAAASFINLAKKARRTTAKEPVLLPKVFTLKKGFTIGCDPEGFLFDKERKVYVPAADVIPGTKYEPHPVDKGAIQVDGMAVEFNTHPVSTFEEWDANITTVIKQLIAALPENLEVHWVPSVKFPESEFDKAPDEAKALGCQPDFNGWTGEVNPPPNMSDPYVRCAGGHIHIGFPGTTNEDTNSIQHVMNCQDLVQQLDWFLGGWSVFHDKDTIRRQLYGKMGACRYKPYGVEYRVLSNFWVETTELRLEVWNRLCSAIDNMNQYFIPDRTGSQLDRLLRQAIDNSYIEPALAQLANFPLKTLDSSCCNL